MKSISKLATGALLAIAIAGSARADDKSQINAVYTTLTNAMRTKDAAAIKSLEGPSFTEKDNQGKTYTKVESNQMMRQQFEMVKSMIKFSLKVTGLKISGKTAAATTEFTMKGKMKLPTDGNVHDVSITGSTKDKLVKSSKGWQFLSSEDLKQTMTVDGKPYNAGG